MLDHDVLDRERVRRCGLVCDGEEASSEEGSDVGRHFPLRHGRRRFGIRQNRQRGAAPKGEPGHHGGEDEDNLRRNVIVVLVTSGHWRGRGRG